MDENQMWLEGNKQSCIIEAVKLEALQARAYYGGDIMSHRGDLQLLLS